jgi:hypothetical protein
MRVVIVGAGAVGQVFGWHLHRSGAEVAFRVRRPEAVRRPFVTHPLRGDPTSGRFDAPVFGTDAEVRAFAPDIALLTVPADALHGAWLAPFLDAVGSGAVIAMEPGAEEDRLIRRARKSVRLTQGIVAFIAYQAPLPGETRFTEPGVAYWLPPFVSCPFSGDVAPAFVAQLRAGGMAATVSGDLSAEGTYGPVALGPWVTALQAAGWSFDRARSSDVLPLGARALVEAVAVVERGSTVPAPRWIRWVGPRLIRTVLRWGPRLVPLDLETYLQFHFTKVGPQVRMHLEEVLHRGMALARPTDALRELLERTASPMPDQQSV